MVPGSTRPRLGGAWRVQYNFIIRPRPFEHNARPACFTPWGLQPHCATGIQVASGICKMIFVAPVPRVKRCPLVSLRIDSRPQCSWASSCIDITCFVSCTVAGRSHMTKSTPCWQPSTALGAPQPSPTEEACRGGTGQPCTHGRVHAPVNDPGKTLRKNTEGRASALWQKPARLEQHLTALPRAARVSTHRRHRPPSPHTQNGPSLPKKGKASWRKDKTTTSSLILWLGQGLLNLASENRRFPDRNRIGSHNTLILLCKTAPETETGLGWLFQAGTH
jgi:hypothetical protein